MDRLISKYRLTPPMERNPSAQIPPYAPASTGAEGTAAAKPLMIVPHRGIGALGLGMSPEQIEAAIEGLLPDSSAPGLQISRDRWEEEGFATIRYQKAGAFFMVRYKDDRAVELSVDRSFGEYAPVLLQDMDVFQTQAAPLVAALKGLSPCVPDCEDEYLATTYLFPRLGIRLWREAPFHEKPLADEAYRKTMALVLEDMYRYLYFDMVSVAHGR